MTPVLTSLHLGASLVALLLQRSPLPSPADSTQQSLTRPVVVRLVVGGACETADSLEADAFELELASDAARRAATGTLRLVRGPDARSEWLQRAAGGEAPRRARLEVDSAGTRVLDAALDGLTVQAYRLTAAMPDPSADAQRLGAEETLAMLRAEQTEAARALETTEALDRSHANARLELPRARERVATLALRVRAQEERLSGIVRGAARRRALDERVTLAFTRLTLRPAVRDSLPCGMAPVRRDGGRR